MSLSRSPMPPRTQPLTRTALARGGTLERRVPIRQVSAKRAAASRVRRAMIRRLYPERPLCAVPWCCGLADDVHEPLTRARGGSITDENNQVPLCRAHHDDVTFRPESELGWAYELGILVHSWDTAREGGGVA